jgi:glutamate dehydrogenase (NAD(P)+)
MVTTIEALKRKRIAVEGARVVVQGFGKVGAPAAYLIEERGAKIIAVSDVQGGIYNAKGLNTHAVLAHATKNGTIVGYAEAEPISNADLLELDCEVLTPCAMENQITRANAARIRAKIIAEGANGPLTPEADEILSRNGIFIIPDILCNAGGVTVSYFEWVQDLQSFFWGEEEINERLRRIMVRSFNQVLRVAEDKKVELRTAAQIYAIQRVAEAMQIRGIYP